MAANVTGKETEISNRIDRSNFKTIVVDVYQAISRTLGHFLGTFGE